LIENVLIVGTGLIGASIGLALREAGFAGEIDGWDASFESLDAAYRAGAITSPLPNRPQTEETKPEPGVIVLAGPVLSILDWMEKLAPICGPDTLITDVGSTKLAISQAAQRLFNRPDRAQFLPGHPMAGKESGGPALAEAKLFDKAMWLFTPVAESTALELEWREWVAKFGCRTMDMDAARHDVLCAWVSHLPQMLSTALAALLEDEFGDAAEIAAIGGRALRETTRLGASPYSMWRDVAMTNTEPIADTLLALEQRLAHLRENLRTPELRDEFARANKFRARRG
jgi:prephenate dehydrogenase